MARKVSSAISSFLANLPAERRREVERVREAVRRYLPAGYADTYNGHPLWYVALASEKSYLSLHLVPVYGDRALAQRLADGLRAAGKKLDMGKACIRFQTADDLPLDVIGQIVARIPPDRWVQIAQAARRR